MSDVHTEHCCLQHGCKYCDAKCPVVLRQKSQSHPCESCDFDKEDGLKLFEVRWSSTLSKRSSGYFNYVDALNFFEYLKSHEIDTTRHIKDIDGIYAIYERKIA